MILILIILGYNYHIHYGRKERFINLIPGPRGYPILGNISLCLGSRENQWKVLTTLNDQYYPIFKVWAFFEPVVFIRHPDDLKTILNSTKHIEKSWFYDALRPWLGTGIFTSGGARWHSQRKMLAPTFHFSILHQFVAILIDESEHMIKSLKNTGGAVVKDLVPFVSEYTLNAVCETIMGISLRNIGASQQQYRKAIHQIIDLYIYRLVRQWLHSDWIFSLTSKSKEQAKVLKILHGFTERIIKERKSYHESTNDQFLKSFNSVISAETNDEEMTGKQKKRLALLDFLIVASREDLLTDLDIREEIDTFLFGGHDTSTMALIFLIMLLAEHKNIQDRVRNEVDTVMKENDGKFTMKSLQDLSYVNRCIKESLRLYPSGFQISRITGEDVKLQSYLVPAGTTIMLNIYGVHRDPKFWPNPDTFDPDRFLPERTQNRHPYSYIPFSAGPRNCIGQQFAMLQMKVMIAFLVHNFYFEPIDYLKNLQLQTDVVLRPSHSLRIRFIPTCKMSGNI